MTEVIEHDATTRIEPQLSHRERWNAKAKTDAQEKARIEADAWGEYHDAVRDGSFDRWPDDKADRMRDILHLTDEQIQADENAVKFFRETPALIAKMNVELLEMNAKSEELRAIADDSKPEKSLAWKIKLATDRLTMEHREALDTIVANNKKARGRQAEIERLQGQIAGLPAWVTD